MGKRTSYANYYPQSSSSQSALSNPVSTDKINGTSSSFSHMPNMNLNLKRNSYASYYNNQDSLDKSSSFLNATNGKLSQMYSGSQSNHDSPTSAHPIWPVLTPSNAPIESVESNKQHSLPAQQKLLSNINSPSNNAEQLQGRNASDQASRPQTTIPFPFKELAKQGVNIKEIVIRNDMAIPTNPNAEGNRSTIPLKAGDKVMLIQTPKGIYLRMGEKIIKRKYHTNDRIKAVNIANIKIAGIGEFTKLS